MTKDMINTIADLRRGQTLVYFTGHLSSVAARPEADDVRLLRDYAFSLYKKGSAVLIQRKIKGGFDYLVKKIR